MIKYCTNNDTLDPELQKWFTDECNSMNASVVVEFIKDDDLHVLRQSCLLFLIAVVFACFSIAFSLCSLFCA